MFHIFVGRQTELEALSQNLEAALRGEEHLVLVAGDAGSGKTTLVQEFCQQAVQRHRELVVVYSTCSTIVAGIGVEPYQPFKDIFRILTAGPDEPMTSTIGPKADDQRARQVFERVIDALMELGPDLVGLFVPAGGLLTKIGTYLANRKGWLKRLESQAKEPKSELSQELIFEQFSRVVLHLATQFPLVLVLDDLQWADHATLNLLFYLVRRVSSEKLLLIGAYRPTDIQQERDGQSHPLVRVLNELQRYFGDVVIDLNQAVALEGRVFVDALVDSEPNVLDETFRKWLVQHTGGQPLFAVEILRDLHEKGFLVLNPQGQWVLSREADLATLPRRVEAVIAERIGRLNGELRSILDCGSVMGETFTMEVISRVEEIERRRLLHALSQELVQQHHLVNEAGSETVNNNRLHFYKFVHALFRDYAYRQLSGVERELLHMTVGQTLELLYGDEVNTIAPQLAQHFHLGHDLAKAARYYELAGHQAAEQYANDDALTFITEALNLIPKNQLLRRIELLSEREKIHELRRDDQARVKDLEEMLAVASEMENASPSIAYVHNRRSLLFLYGFKDKSTAYEEAKRAKEIASVNHDQVNLAFAYNNLGRVCHHQREYEKAVGFLNTGLDIYQEIKERRGESHCLAWIGLSLWYLDEIASLPYFEHALQIRKELGEKWLLSHSLRNVGSYFLTRNLNRAYVYLSESLNLRSSVGDLYGAEDVEADLAIFYCYVGKFNKAESLYGPSYVRFTNWSSDVLPMIFIERGDYDRVIAMLDDPSLKDYRSRNSGYLAQNRHMMGRTYLLNKDVPKAKQNLKLALEIRTKINQNGNQNATLALLGRTLRAFGDTDKATHTALKAIRRLEQSPNTGYYQPQEIWFDCYKALEGLDEMAIVALQRAYELVVMQAERLTNQQWRHSYLNDVRLNREIVAEWDRRNMKTE